MPNAIRRTVSLGGARPLGGQRASAGMRASSKLRCYTLAMKIEKYGTGADVQELRDIRESIGALLDSHTNRAPLTPRADLVDLGHSFQLHIEVPGVELADLEIATDEDELHIAGLREPNFELGEQIFSERAVGPFQRTFQLPEPVDAETGSAHLSAGVLVVTLPKKG